MIKVHGEVVVTGTTWTAEVVEFYESSMVGLKLAIKYFQKND